jgi:hypothetical protein
MAFVKKLDAEHAVIHTATVEVKTLTISGKQVTLAVFRQLPEREIIDPQTGNLCGIPWGLVNYHFKDCEAWMKDDHLHVVWQSGGVLYRSMTPGWRNSPRWRETYAQLAVLDQLFIAV